MCWLKNAIFSLCIVLVRSESIIDQSGQYVVESSVCKNIAIIFNDLETENNENNSWKYNSCDIDNNDVCAACKDMVSQLRNSSTKFSKVDEFISLCNAYDVESLSRLCENIKRQCYEEFANLLGSKTTTSFICSSIQGSQITMSPAAVSKDDLWWKACDEILQVLKWWFISEPIKLTVLNAMKIVCEFTTGDLKKECVHHAHNYYEYFYNYVDKIDSSFCTGNTGIKDYVADVGKIFFIQNIIQVAPDLLQSSESKFCSPCKFFVQLIQTELDDPIVVEGITSVVKQLCKFISNSNTRLCGQYTKEFSHLIITFIAIEAGPSLICPMMKLCPSEEFLLKNTTINTSKVLPTNWSQDDYLYT